jgi:hypothetical protein
MTGPAGDGIDERAARRNLGLLLLAVAGLALLGVAAGTVAAVARGHGPRHPALAVAFGVGAVTVAVGVVAAAIAVIWRRPEYRRVMQFGWFERRRVQRAVKAGRPLGPRERAVARASRDYLVRFRRVQWVAPVVAAFWLFDGLTHHGVARWLLLAAAAGYAATVPVAMVQWRRAIDRYDRALSHPGPTG